MKIVHACKWMMVLSLAWSSGCETVESDTPGQDFESEDSNAPDKATPEQEDADDKEDPKDSKDKKETEDAQPSEDPGEEKPKTPEPDEEEDPESPEPKDEERDCSKIAWGDDLKRDEIVARGDTRGYFDEDGDNRVERKENDVGMCQLHRTGKKCGLVMYARKT